MVWTKTRTIPANHQETCAGGRWRWWLSFTTANWRRVNLDWFTGHSSSARGCRGLGLSTLPWISAHCCPSMVGDTKTSGTSIVQWGGNGEGNSRSPRFSGSPEMARGSVLATSHRCRSRESSKWSEGTPGIHERSSCSARCQAETSRTSCMAQHCATLRGSLSSQLQSRKPCSFAGHGSQRSGQIHLLPVFGQQLTVSSSPRSFFFGDWSGTAWVGTPWSCHLASNPLPDAPSATLGTAPPWKSQGWNMSQLASLHILNIPQL